jgi:hypothetical protein
VTSVAFPAHNHRARFRPRSHCHFVLPLIHFTPNSLRDSVSVSLFRKQQCDRTLTGSAQTVGLVQATDRDYRRAGYRFGSDLAHPVVPPLYQGLLPVNRMWVRGARRRAADTLRHAQKRSGMLKNAQRHSKTLRDTQRRSETLRNAQKHAETRRYAEAVTGRAIRAPARGRASPGNENARPRSRALRRPQS